MSSVITDRAGVRYVEGKYGAYAIDSLAWLADHDPVTVIDELLGKLATGHPDVDVLLDARNELTLITADQGPDLEERS